MPESYIHYKEKGTMLEANPDDNYAFLILKTPVGRIVGHFGLHCLKEAALDEFIKLRGCF